MYFESFALQTVAVRPCTPIADLDDDRVGVGIDMNELPGASDRSEIRATRKQPLKVTIVEWAAGIEGWIIPGYLIDRRMPFGSDVEPRRRYDLSSVSIAPFVKDEEAEKCQIAHRCSKAARTNGCLGFVNTTTRRGFSADRTPDAVFQEFCQPFVAEHRFGGNGRHCCIECGIIEFGCLWTGRGPTVFRCKLCDWIMSQGVV